MNILALDFDGVLCDSVRETGVSAWRAGREIWPEWGTTDPPPEVLDAFVRMRPALETGFQAIPMMRLAADGVPPETVLADGVALFERVIRSHGLDKNRLVALFGAARDAWIRNDPDGWLDAHDFFPGTIETFHAVMRTTQVYILTTKQERFVHRLLQGAGVDFDQARVYGLERGVGKEQTLDMLATMHPEGVIHFVEDRLPTLHRIEAAPTLADIKLYYADWGYGTQADLVEARASDRITVWSLQEFLKI
ncbi:MAG: HAD family hydrolase [Lentisphaeria bacterium]|nr:HAD family hydrolase [Lentisphaeria bacterium]